MNRGQIRITLVILAIAAICATAGYWAGFRQAWQMGVMADYAPRGGVALGNTRLLEAQRVSDLRAQFASEVIPQ